MNKLEGAPKDYIAWVYTGDGALVVAISIRGEVVIYGNGGARKTTQVGFVSSTSFSRRKLWLLNSDGLLQLDVDTLELEEINVHGGQHVAVTRVSDKEMIVVGDSHQLYLYANGTLNHEVQFEGKIIGLQVKDYTLLVCVAASGTTVENKIYNLADGSLAFFCSDSPGLGYPLVTNTCVVQSLPNFQYIQSSMEGKVAICRPNGESFVFRPHKQTLTDQSLLAQPVLSIANRDQFLVTGGDGVLGIWDINTKKRVSQIKNLGGVVTALAANARRIIVAIGDGGVKNSDLEHDLHLDDSQLYEMEFCN